jgi:hypothetical protein
MNLKDSKAKVEFPPASTVEPSEKTQESPFGRYDPSRTPEQRQKSRDDFHAWANSLPVRKQKTDSQTKPPAESPSVYPPSKPTKAADLPSDSIAGLPDSDAEPSKSDSAKSARHHCLTLLIEQSEQLSEQRGRE